MAVLWENWRRVIVGPRSGSNGSCCNCYPVSRSWDVASTMVPYSWPIVNQTEEFRKHPIPLFAIFLIWLISIIGLCAWCSRGLTLGFWYSICFFLVSCCVGRLAPGLFIENSLSWHDLGASSSSSIYSSFPLFAFSQITNLTDLLLQSSSISSLASLCSLETPGRVDGPG